MNNNTKNILLGVLIVGLVGMTIAYAALSTRLQISGTVSVPEATWDIELSNLTRVSNVASAVLNQQNTASGPASITVTNGTAISGLNVTFNQPGDKIQYNFTISNLGSIDAKLSAFSESLTLPSGYNGTMTQEQVNSNFTHSIICNPTQSNYSTAPVDYLDKIGTKASPATTAGNNHDVANCTLTIQWNEANNQNQNTPGSDQTYTQAALTLDYNAQWTYVQK